MSTDGTRCCSQKIPFMNWGGGANSTNFRLVCFRGDMKSMGHLWEFGSKKEMLGCTYCFVNSHFLSGLYNAPPTICGNYILLDTCLSRIAAVRHAYVESKLILVGKSENKAGEKGQSASKVPAAATILEGVFDAMKIVWSYAPILNFDGPVVSEMRVADVYLQYHNPSARFGSEGSDYAGAKNRGLMIISGDTIELFGGEMEKEQLLRKLLTEYQTILMAGKFRLEMIPDFKVVWNNMTATRYLRLFYLL